MANDLEYALMAGGRYISTRADKIQFPLRQDWMETFTGQNVRKSVMALVNNGKGKVAA